MKVLSILFVLLIATCAIAEDILYVSVLANGNPPMLLVRKFGRTSSTAPYKPLEMASIPLTIAGGVTDLQFNSEGQLHVYFTQFQGSKARVVRQTIDITSGVSFVSGSTKNFPANLSSITNFDTNDAMALLQKVTGSQLHAQMINGAGNLLGAFKAQPRFPSVPFSSHISEAKPFFTTALWTEPTSGRTGVTFQNVNAPANSKSYLFTGRIIAHDISLTVPKSVQASSIDEDGECDDDPEDPEDGCAELATDNEDDDDLRASETKTSRITTFVRLIRRKDFVPVGNTVKITSPRVPSAVSSAHQFNGLDIEPLATAIFYLRQGSCGNEVIVQTYNPTTRKKIGGPKVAFPCIPDSVIYGISSLNSKFKNGFSQN